MDTNEQDQSINQSINQSISDVMIVFVSVDNW